MRRKICPIMSNVQGKMTPCLKKNCEFWDKTEKECVMRVDPEQMTKLLQEQAKRNYALEQGVIYNG